MQQISEYKKANTARRLALAGLSLAWLASPARSQDEAELATHELDAMVVSANRMEMPVQRVGSSVELLERFELERGQETLLLDVLRSVPGIHLRNNGSPGAVFGMTTRGLSSNRPKVLINGIEAGNPADGEIMNLGNVFTGNLSKVEILKGPQSSLYGADALAGVIAVETLGPGERQGGRASLGYGSFETFDYSIGHSGSLGRFSWAVNGVGRESEGYSVEDPARGPAWADDDAYDNKSFTGAFEYRIDEDARLFLSALVFDSFAEFDPGNPEFVFGEPAGDNTFNSDKILLRAGSDFRIAENWTSTASVHYADVDTLSFSDGSEFPSDGERYELDWVNTLVASESWSFVAGAEYEEEENRSDGGDRDNASVFMENVFRVSEKLDWTLGGRFDDNSAYGEEATWRSTFSYRLDDLDARIRGTFGTSFQAPSFFQLFNGFFGNPELKPESGEGWDLGVEKRFADGRVLLSSTLFGNEVTDKIIFTNSTFGNVDRYESVGVETSLSYRVSDTLQVAAAHTYSDAEENGSVEALRVPRNVASLNLHWTPLDGRLGVNFEGLFVSSQFSDNGERAAGVRLPGYEVFNLALRYRLDERYSLWLRAGNLFDEDYQEISGFQTAGANLNGGVRMRF